LSTDADFHRILPHIPLIPLVPWLPSELTAEQEEQEEQEEYGKAIDIFPARLYHQL
jgi:hypothetical protein